MLKMRFKRVSVFFLPCVLLVILLTSCGSRNSDLFQETYFDGQYTIHYIDNNDGTCAIYDCEGELPEIFSVPEYTSSGLMVTSLNDDCFFGNSDRVTDVIIPDTIQKIGAYVFGMGRGIRHISLGKNVDSISCFAFCDAESIEIISCDDNDKYMDIDGKCLTDINGQTLILGTSSGFIPNSISKIGDYAFASTVFISDMVIPENVTEIGRYAFTFSFNLGDVNLSNNIISVGEGAFSYSDVRSVRGGQYEVLNSKVFADCEFLTYVSLPQSLCTIRRCAFLGNEQLKVLHIPNHVSNMEEYAISSFDTQICCEAFVSPTGWAENWSGDNTSIIWGCSPNNHTME